MGSPFILPRAGITPLTAPPGFPPDVAPNQIIYASHINAIRDSVAVWPGNVDGNTKNLVNAGKIAIGHSTPTVPLHISAGGLGVAIDANPPTGSVYARVLSGGAEMQWGLESAAGGTLVVGGLPYAGIVNIRGAHSLQLATNDLARLTVSPTGDVGIGTITPFGSARLHLRTGTDENLLFLSHQGLSDGINIQSLNDAISVHKSLEIVASIIRIQTMANRLRLSGLPVYAGNAAAAAAGLVAGDLYIASAGDPRPVCIVT